MPQVAARINEQQERWLKDYFRTKSAGAEFILPWAVDTFFRAITTIKGTFTGPELKTILEAHRDQRLLPAHTRLSYLLLRVADLCEQTDFHSRYGASRTSQAETPGRHRSHGPYGLGFGLLGKPQLLGGEHG